MLGGECRIEEGLAHCQIAPSLSLRLGKCAARAAELLASICLCIWRDLSARPHRAAPPVARAQVSTRREGRERGYLGLAEASAERHDQGEADLDEENDETDDETD